MFETMDDKYLELINTQFINVPIHHIVGHKMHSYLY